MLLFILFLDHIYNLFIKSGIEIINYRPVPHITLFKLSRMNEKNKKNFGVVDDVVSREIKAFDDTTTTNTAKKITATNLMVINNSKDHQINDNIIEDIDTQQKEHHEIITLQQMDTSNLITSKNNDQQQKQNYYPSKMMMEKKNLKEFNSALFRKDYMLSEGFYGDFLEFGEHVFTTMELLEMKFEADYYKTIKVINKN